MSDWLWKFNNKKGWFTVMEMTKWVVNHGNSEPSVSYGPEGSAWLSMTGLTDVCFIVLKQLQLEQVKK